MKKATLVGAILFSILITSCTKSEVAPKPVFNLMSTGDPKPPIPPDPGTPPR